MLAFIFIIGIILAIFGLVGGTVVGVVGYVVSFASSHPFIVLAIMMVTVWDIGRVRKRNARQFSEDSFIRSLAGISTEVLVQTADHVMSTRPQYKKAYKRLLKKRGVRI